MNKRRIILLFTLVIILLVSITAISAVDNSTTVTTSSDTSIVNTQLTISNDTQSIATDNIKLSVQKKDSNNYLKDNSKKQLNTITQIKSVTKNTQNDDENSSLINTDNYTDNNDNIQNQTNETINNNNTYTDDNTIYINNSYTGIETGTQFQPYTTLNNGFIALNNETNTKSNVYIANGIYNINDTIIINKNLTITGESQGNTIISGGNQYQIFNITQESTVNVNNLTFTLANATNGAAILNNGNLSITNATFLNNSAIENGGAIYNTGTLNITSSSFINNSAIENGGAIINNGIITVNYNMFMNNQDKYNRMVFNNGTVNSFDYNWWSSNNPNNLVNFKLYNWIIMTFTNITPFELNKDVNLTVTLNTIEDENETITTLNNTELLPIANVTYQLSNETINIQLLDNNRSNTISNIFTKSGEEISATINGYTILFSKKLDIIYVNSSIETSGTGESWINPVKTIQEAMNYVSNNGTILLAEGIYNSTNDYNLIINQNINIIGETQNNVIINGLKANRIMSITQSNNVTITNITFINGNSTNGAAINNNGNLIISNCNFINNTVSQSGGAIYSQNNIELYNSNFTNNSARIGGAIRTINKELIINNCTFTNNSALYNKTSGWGGALALRNITSIISNSSFYTNHASYVGGAIDVEYGNYTIDNCIFIKNNVYKLYGQYGGAITIHSSNSNITNSIFYNNSGSYGGAIDIENSNLLVTNNTLINNTAIYGGAINNLNTIITYKNNNMTKNYAQRGGAIYSYNSNNTIINTTFGSNQAQYGGAIYAQNKLLNIYNSTFQLNNAKIYGGALYNTGSKLNIYRTILSNNYAGKYGGAIYNTNNGIVTTSYSVIINNKKVDIYNVKGSVNAKYNWWGSNSNPNYSRIHNTVANHYIYMTVTLNNKSTYVNKNTTATVSLNNYYYNGKIVSFNSKINNIPTIPITQYFTEKNKNYYNNGFIINGTYIGTHKNLYKGTLKITTTINNQKITKTITVKK